MLKIGIINCGISNLTSVKNAFDFLSIPVEVINASSDLENCSHIVLPGVGAFPKGINNLKTNGFDEAIKIQLKKGKPLLGICLGMQMLAMEGEEFTQTQGLALIPGKVTKIEVASPTLRLPHVGWNNVSFVNSCPLWKSIPDHSTFYFVHTYAFSNLSRQYIAGETEYSSKIISAVFRDNVYGVQFHPEKSQKAGLQLLKNFASLC